MNKKIEKLDGVDIREMTYSNYTPDKLNEVIEAVNTLTERLEKVEGTIALVVSDKALKDLSEQDTERYMVVMRNSNDQGWVVEVTPRTSYHFEYKEHAEQVAEKIRRLLGGKDE